MGKALLTLPHTFYYLLRTAVKKSMDLDLTADTYIKGTEVKKFMFLHIGFEDPTPEIMDAWMAWFESIADKQVDQGGFAGGRELSKSGSRDLPWDKDCITGYNIIEADSMEAAEKLAQNNPFITSIRIYELRSM